MHQVTKPTCGMYAALLAEDIAVYEVFEAEADHMPIIAPRHEYFTDDEVKRHRYKLAVVDTFCITQPVLICVRVHAYNRALDIVAGLDDA